jgi:hypothetical protein
VSFLVSAGTGRFWIGAAQYHLRQDSALKRNLFQLTVQYKKTMLRGWIGPQLIVLASKCRNPLRTTGSP